MGTETTLSDEKWRILLDSSKKFVALAQYRNSQNDHVQAVSVLNQTLQYVSPAAFDGSPPHILKEMLQLNIQIYLELTETFLNLKKYDIAKSCLRQVLISEQNNEQARDLLKRIEQQCPSEHKQLGLGGNPQLMPAHVDQKY